MTAKPAKVWKIRYAIEYVLEHATLNFQMGILYTTTFFLILSHIYLILYLFLLFSFSQVHLPLWLDDRSHEV